MTPRTVGLVFLAGTFAGIGIALSFVGASAELTGFSFVGAAAAFIAACRIPT